MPSGTFKIAGVKFQIVDAGTAANKTTELLGQRLDVIGTQAGLVKDYYTTGEFTCLGVLADERLEGAPDIPTLKEQGYKFLTIDEMLSTYGPSSSN